MTDDPRCQGTATKDAACKPWDGTPRAEDHDALAQLLRETPEGAPIIWLARTLFGDYVESGDADWQFVKRHCERYHEVFRPRAWFAVKIYDEDDEDNYENRQTEPGLLWVDPTITLGEVVLDHNRSGVSIRGGGEPGATTDTATAKMNAERVLSRHRTLDTADEYAALIGAFGAKRVGEERGECQRTRFNDVGRARQSPNRVATAFAGALAAGHSRGVVVTPTTDPKCFDSALGAAEGLIKDVRLLRKWLDCPPGVTVVGSTERASPHAHVALFGVDRDALPSEHALHDYWWEHRERGHQVGLQSIVADGEGDGATTWTWVGDGPADAAGCSPRDYLKREPLSLVRAARADAEDLRSVAAAYRERGDAPMNVDTAANLDAAVSAETGVDAASVKRSAWYFGTGLKAATRPSRVLRSVVESEGENS